MSLARALALASLLSAAPALAQEPVDLLRAVPADLAVSSAYRDRIAQAAALVDGDLGTAWNSRTGELVGAWIEVRVPADATVTGIALTAGFTRPPEGRTDLFTGNHRVTRVRVLREGREVGVYDLDPESRGLQTLPASGRGGVWRIEVAAVQPGSRRDWREVCISELRVLGRAPGAREGQRFPRVAVGALPGPRPAPSSADREEVRRQLDALTRRMETDWAELNREQGNRLVACDFDEQERNATATLRQRRQRFLLEVAALVERVDEARAEPLRAAAFSRNPNSPNGGHERFLEAGDQDAIAAGFAAVVDWLGDGEARCRWASVEAALRLTRALNELRGDNHVCEHWYEADELPREVERECRAVEPALERLQEAWWERAPVRNVRTAAARLRRFSPSPHLSQPFRDEWRAFETAIATATQACGW
ncbi:MAG TPA: hypothetical protein VIL20_25600 [Sandaracinaceae bacterium]